MHSANKILCMIFFLPPPPSLPHPLYLLSLFPSLLGLLSPPKNLCVEMASALVGSENVQCTIVAMEQADRQAALPPSPLSGLFTRFPSIRLIYVLTLLGL